jgi:hypothetical protein
MPKEQPSDATPETAAETSEIKQETIWPIRAEIALPTPKNMRPDGGNLPEYQRCFTRAMYEKGAMLKCLFGSAVHAIHPQTGIIDVIGLPDTIAAILKASRGEILALRHHWEKTAVMHSKTFNNSLPPEMAIH